MPCDTRLRNRNQTMTQRKAEIRLAEELLDKLIMKKKVKPVVGPQGAIAFQGWKEEDRAGMTDACAYRRLMMTGSALTKAEIERAEQLAGTSVNRQVIGSGVHSHDGGRSWHEKD